LSIKGPVMSVVYQKPKLQAAASSRKQVVSENLRELI
jgi:hypothetical protein